MLRSVRVTGWNELITALYEESWQPALGRFRSGRAFCGLSGAGQDLRSGLARLTGNPAIETHLLRNFRKYARTRQVGNDTMWDWLALAQHHGLPTRLLDWTYSPLVAAHFATEPLDLRLGDSVIWTIDYRKCHRLLPRRLQQVLAEEGADVFTSDLLERVARSLAELDRIAGSAELLFFEPPSLDDRIVNQFALFSMLTGVRANLDDWVAAHPDLCTRIVIPEEAKPEIRDKLDQANITERVLFPGLDGLCRWLARYYGQAPSSRAHMPARDGS